MIYNLIDNCKKKWIVLLHCVCGNENVFKYQMEMLNKHYNIVVIRLAGYDIDSQISEATFEFVVEEIHKFVVEKNCRIDIMGLSIGAMIATKYILKYGDEVENSYLIGNIYGFSIPLFRLGYMTLLKINKVLPRAVYMYAITRLILPYKSQKQQRKILYTTSKRMKEEFLYSWMNEMGIFITHGKEYFKQISDSFVNIRHIYGANDIMFLGWLKKRNQGRHNIQLHIIEDAGHLCNMEKPNQVNTIIEGDNSENASSH